MAAPTLLDLRPFITQVQNVSLLPWTGEVAEVVGLLIASRGPAAAIGDICEVTTATGRCFRTQVIGFRDGLVLSLPLEPIEGVQLHDRVVARRDEACVPVSPDLVGRVLDGFGRPIDRGAKLNAHDRYPLCPPPGSPLDREHITEPIITGIRAIDGMLLCGKGQRLGIFGGSGVGKSTLLGSMARHNSADVTVIALIGERNREVREFLEHEMGPDGAKRSVVVCATSDQPAPLRVRACYVALSIAEYFRNASADVLFIMDSVTRLAMAQREIGLAAGEPPSQKGYTPSVFNLLPTVLERAGRFQKGSISGFFTVLVEGDDMNEPISDCVRAILDGHIILSRRLAASAHYPAIDVSNSVSRLFPQLAAVEHAASAAKVREAIAVMEESRDLVDFGAYVPGKNPKIDAAIAVQPDITAFLRQGATVKVSFDETCTQLQAIAGRL